MNPTTNTILYCGSFNPVHRGHIAVAEQVLGALPEAELWFVVSPHNPLKESSGLAPEQHRLRMMEIAVENSRLRERMQVCDIEFSLPKPSATITTLDTLAECYPQRRFTLLIGGDNVQGFGRWIAYERILERYPVLVYPRDGYSPETSPLAGRFNYLTNVPLLPQAATDVREWIASNDTSEAPEALPEDVWEYIKTHRLYGYR